MPLAHKESSRLARTRPFEVDEMPYALNDIIIGSDHPLDLTEIGKRGTDVDGYRLKLFEHRFAPPFAPP